MCVSSESHCLFLDPWTSAPNESTTFSAWFFSRDLFTLESLERRFHITRAFSSQFRKCFHKISGSLSCLNSLRDRKFTTYSRQSKLKNCICKFPERYSLYAFFYDFHSVILTPSNSRHLPGVQNKFPLLKHKNEQPQHLT